ncbi:MAG: hypothetical protein GY737_31010 [Desulfobacteraceae bacterium]|nr:hypothetical protein [Desulfobacteraceae bacterium]
MKKFTFLSFLFILGLISFYNTPFVFADISDGLVAYYPFDGDAKDKSGNKNNGTVHGAILTEDRFGNANSAYYFDGIDDYITVLDSLDLRLNNTDFTLSAWIYETNRNSSYQDAILVKRGYGNQNGWFWSIRGSLDYELDDIGKAHYHVSGGYDPSAKSTQKIVLNSWTHLLVKYRCDDQTINIYINGVLDNTVYSIPSPNPTNASKLMIGADSHVNETDRKYHFHGKIDDIAIYNRALSEEEISFLSDKSKKTEKKHVYFYSVFSNGVPAEFSGSGNVEDVQGYADIGNGNNRFKGNFLRNTSGSNHTILTLSNLPYHTKIDLNFLLAVIDSWDGYCNYSYCRDQFNVMVDGKLIFSEVLDNAGVGSQSYVPPPGVDLFSGDKHLGFNSRWDDDAYDLGKDSRFKDIAHSSETLTIEWFANGPGLEQGNNESWAIDNVEVSLDFTNIIGKNLKTSPNHEFSLEQYTQTNESIWISNSTDEYQSATLEIINPHSVISVSFDGENAINLEPQKNFRFPVTIDSGRAPIGKYDDILIKLMDENGESLYSKIIVTVLESGGVNLPDLSVCSENIKLVDYTLDGTASLQATVYNKGSEAASNIQIQFYEFGNLLGETVIPAISSKETETAITTVPITTSGEHLIRVVIDSQNTIDEFSETNNEASQIIKIGSPAPIPGNILVTGNLPTTVYTDRLFTISGRAMYDVYVNGTRYTNYAVKGGSVQFTIEDETNKEWVYGGIHSDTNGYFSKRIQAPPSAGNYKIIMTVTDQTFTGKRELLFSVTNPPPQPPSPPNPPLPPGNSGSGHWNYSPGTPGSPGVPGSPSSWTWNWTNPPANAPVLATDLFVFSENIHFSNYNPEPDDEISIFAKINYWANNTDMVAQAVPINFYVTYPGTPKLKIGETLINEISVGSPDFGSRYVFASWKNHTQGLHIVEVEIDPEYAEENKMNNAATRALMVGQLQQHHGAIAGQVTDPWGGVKDITIELYDSDGTTFLENKLTDSTGYYLFENVPIDNYIVRIIKPDGYQVDGETKPAEVTDQTVTEVNFYLAKLEGPVADAGGPYKGSIGVPVILDAGNSHDPDGEIVSYQWDYDGDGIFDGTSSSPTLEYTWDQEFEGTIILQVTDNDGLSATDTALVTIKNSPPNCYCCDLDDDCDCDTTDYNLFINAYGKSPEYQEYIDKADYDDDDLVSLTDYQQWYQCYWEYQEDEK